jgi:cell division protein FtsN
MPPRDYKSNTYRTAKPKKKMGLDSWDRLLIVAFITVLALVIKHFIQVEQAKPRPLVPEQVATAASNQNDAKVAAATSAVATVAKEVAAAGGLSADEMNAEPNSAGNPVAAATGAETKTNLVPTAAVPPRQDSIPVEPHFDFYTILPSVEVVIPDHEIKTRIREEKIGVGDQTAKYIMQAGSFRDSPDADELKAKLTTMGIESRIEKAQVGEVMWYRVKVGPYAGMTSVMAIKSQLRSQGIDAIVLEFK